MRKVIDWTAVVFIWTLIAATVVALALWGTVLFAAPAIHSAAQNGDIITINGVNFGSAATIVSWDDFESGANGLNLAWPLIGPKWSFLHPSSNTPVPSYSNARAHSGALSASVTWKEPGWPGYSINAFGWANQGPYRALYLTWWEYLDVGVGNIEGTFNRKSMYTYGGAGSNEVQQWLPIITNRGGDSYYMASIIQNSPARIFYWSPGLSYSAIKHTWSRWETYVDWGSVNGRDGELEVWRNGTQHLAVTGEVLCTTGDGNSIHDWRLGHMFQGYGEVEHARAYFDNVYVATSRARVEIGNNSSFTACTHREILPVTTWGASQITAPLPSASAMQYIFIIDENGDASAGFELGTTQEPPPPTLDITGYERLAPYLDCMADLGYTYAYRVDAMPGKARAVSPFACYWEFVRDHGGSLTDVIHLAVLLAEQGLVFVEGE